MKGLGCDILSMQRVQNLYKQFPNRLPQKILSSKELKEFQCDPQWEYLAIRFSVKEAAYKATQQHTWKQLTLSKIGRRPVLTSDFGCNLLVSISHDSGMCMSVVTWL